MSKVSDLWRPVRARLREPSSWNGISMLLLLFGVASPEVATVIEMAPDVVIATEGSEVWRNSGLFGSFIAAIVSVVMRERDKKDVDSDTPTEPAV